MTHQVTQMMESSLRILMKFQIDVRYSYSDFLHMDLHAYLYTVLHINEQFVDKVVDFFIFFSFTLVRSNLKLICKFCSSHKISFFYVYLVSNFSTDFLC